MGTCYGFAAKGIASVAQYNDWATKYVYDRSIGVLFLAGTKIFLYIIACIPAVYSLGTNTSV